MGKRVKKARAGHKEKLVPTSSSRAVKNGSNQSSEIVDDVAVLEKDKKQTCVHLEKALDLTKVSSKLESADCTGCEDCRAGFIDRKGGRGKGRVGKKKGCSDSKATWVCLQCGHLSCGGVGLPSDPQYHAFQHSRQYRHPLVIQMENPRLRWCFPCRTLVTIDKFCDNDEQKDVLADVVKRLKNQSSKTTSMDVEDIWFGSRSVTSDLKSENKVVSVPSGNDFSAVRGLVNLGNTCFFNSVMQNLLATDLLREYLLTLDGPVGSLTSALQKIFVETSSESGSRSGINPKQLFGCICAKAPQFRGYQQQDSHELLRCLLDGLSTEDMCAKRSAKCTLENGTSVPISSTFIDAIFGGQISSTVCCVECGHSSVVSEPFLDLSLPVPTKKPSPKKFLPVSRTKKTKLPAKRGSQSRPKLNRVVDRKSTVSGCNPSSSSGSSFSLIGAPFGCNSSTDLVESGNLVDMIGMGAEDKGSTQPDSNSAQVSQSSGAEVCTFAWLDYLEPVTQETDTWFEDFVPVPLSNDHNSSLGIEDLLVPLDTRSEANFSSSSSTVYMQDAVESSGEIGMQTDYICSKPSVKLDDGEDGHPPLVQNNQVLLLTYKEDDTGAVEDEKQDTQVSSAAVGDEEDTLGFVGLGDLFDEPEQATMPSAVSNDSQVIAQLGNGFLTGNSTESDPDEVDNADAPVSVEGCLAHFVKPELLCGEHAWHCENCSRLQQKERLKLPKNQLKPGQPLLKLTSKSECPSSEAVQVAIHPSSDSSSSVVLAHNNGSSEPHESLEMPNNMQDGLDDALPEQNGEIYELNDASSCTTSFSVCPKLSDEVICGDHSVNSDSLSADYVATEEQPGLKEQESGEDVKDADICSKSVKVLKDATKRMLVSKSPLVLTIHLKRFAQDTRGRLNKLNGHVVFKEFIDLGPYMDHRSNAVDTCVYCLVGVVEHSGSMRGGHYVAYVRGGDKRKSRPEEGNHRQRHTVWYYASDAHVRETTLEEVLRSEAYILFYEKVQS